MRAYLFVCLFFIAINANAQSFTIAGDKMNIAYIGIENPLTIVADNATCAELMVTTENGTIQKKDSCHFYFAPVREGKAILTIQKKVNGKNVTIGMQELRVKSVPNAEATVGNKRSGFYSLAAFKVQLGVSVKMGDSFIDNYFMIISFHISIVRNNQVIYNDDINGNLFNNNVKNNFNQLRVGDVVRIDNIKATCPNCRIRSLGELIYTMR